MGEKRRRQLNEAKNTHQGFDWRVNEIKLMRLATEQVLAHDSRADGTFRRGDAMIAAEEAAQARAERDKRGKSNFLGRLAQQARTTNAVRSERKARAALKLQRSRVKSHGQIASSQSKAAA